MGWSGLFPDVKVYCNNCEIRDVNSVQAILNRFDTSCDLECYVRLDGKAFLTLSIESEMDADGPWPQAVEWELLDDELDNTAGEATENDSELDSESGARSSTGPEGEEDRKRDDDPEQLLDNDEETCDDDDDEDDEHRAQVFKQHGKAGFLRLLCALAPHLLEPLTIQAAGFWDGEPYPIDACEWHVEPGSNSVEVNEFKHTQEL